MPKRVLSEAQVRRIINEEIAYRLIQEGMWDDVKAGAAKLKAYATKQFGTAASKWSSAIQNKLSKLELPDGILLVIQALKAGMNESGESVKLGKTLKLAKQLGTVNALAVAQEDFEGPVHDYAAKVQQSGVKAEALYRSSIYATLTEAELPQPETLKEVDVVGAFGIGLAVLGGLPMIFAGLKKLAEVLHAHKLAELFEKAEHVSHAVEVKTIDIGIPDRLAYVAYTFLHKKGLKFSKETQDILSFDEFKSDSDGSHSLKQIKGLMYKALLIYFAFNGLVGVLKAGASLLGFVEGAATTVKGIELARGATEIAALLGKSA
jgi:hypothetical protein